MSSSSIAVGRATTEDVAAIAQFNIAMAAETEDLALDPQTVHAGVAAVVSDDRRGFYLVARSCLLYTSPSPRDGLLSRMPSSA